MITLIFGFILGGAVVGYLLWATLAWIVGDAANSCTSEPGWAGWRKFVLGFSWLRR